MHDSSYQEMKRFTERCLDHEQELSILDVGSLDVNGSYKPLFANPKWTYTGLDLVPGPNVDIVSEEPYRYPFSDDSFDVVISGSVLEHVEDVSAFVREIARVMKPDGILCVIAPWTYPEHKYPRDCWRILPDGMKLLLEKVAGVNVLDIHKNETDCVGIAGTVKRDIQVSFGCITNDAYRLNTVLAKSALPGRLHFLVNPESATKGLNVILCEIEREGADVAVLAHQDMYFRNGWLKRMKEQLSLLPESWVVAGVIGKDHEGRMCGNIHDMRIVDHINTTDVHTFPHPAVCFDECVLIINMKKGFRFDEELDGFDLYGTLCVLQAWEMGGTAWAIDAFCEHYCTRPFSWFPGDDFKARYKWLYDRFIEKFGQPDSTVFVSKPRFETSAA